MRSYLVLSYQFLVHEAHDACTVNSTLVPICLALINLITGRHWLNVGVRY
jgi:hypothetical protein